MSISTPFIRRPIATSLLMAAIFLAGLAAFPLLPVAPLPNVEFPTLTVTANYPGASPQTMASTVATPLETEFGQMLPGLSQMTSTSVLGTSQITLQFDLSTNIASAATLVLEAINAAQGSLPKNMPTPPTFREVNPSDAPILIMAMQSDQAPITEVDEYAENLFEQQLSQLPGVGQVLVGGQQTPAIRVQIDPAKLASMGLTLEDVRNVLTNATVDDPKAASTDRSNPTPSTPTTSSRRQVPTTRLSSPIATAPRFGSAISAKRSTVRKTVNSRPGATASARCFCWSSSRPMPT